ncbi:hypothetical protein [Acanthopleuribacter pedis]|uniref:Uncharacterized protein n=1 Tax=Acanthopleuribacter pedis TaxID=442870 RepID=A0A8J7U1L8_9BACT|nr:hypothetical protein [Acanthopleuribacter pedis]MBO1318333.1 hypothetical protein [Acanthopleuribacter pedis]
MTISTNEKSIGLRYFDLGVAVTVVLAIFAGAVQFGIMKGRLDEIHGNVNVQLIKDELHEEAERLKSQIKSEAFSSGLPIGAVIASVLPPDKFSMIANNEPYTNLDFKKFSWVLAAGQKDLPLTCGFVEKTGKTELPDLRAVFLRGINFGRDDVFSDPDKERIPGSIQPHALQSHVHPYFDRYSHDRTPKDNGNWPEALRKDANERKETEPQANASTETRPNNAAVYFYIKVN